jgi:hypothetical protein
MARPFLAPLTALALVASIAACGSGTTRSPGNRELALERAQLVHVVGGLHAVVGPVRREVTAARTAWPLIANGLPPALPGTLRAAVGRAVAGAQALAEPPFLANATQITGPAAGIAGLYESYERLAERGWRLTEAGIDAIVSANPTAASFERENSPLYIDAIYDSHFNLSLVGKSLMSAYEQLGGPQAFGATLPQSEINALAATYSIPAVRLEPHPGDLAREG